MYSWIGIGSEKRRMIRRQPGSIRPSFGEFLRIGAPEIEVEAWHALLDEIGKILRRADGFRYINIVLAEAALKRCPKPLRQFRIVVHKVGTLIAIDRGLACSSCGSGFGLGDSADCSQDLLADVRFERTNGKAHLCLIRDDV